MIESRTADCRPPTADFSLYIHIPYCQSKCPYCDFNSHAAAQWPEKQYAAALIAELDHFAAQDAWRERQLGTIFLGGGTPSLFSPITIARILEAANRLWPTTLSVEVTLEANPGTVTLEKLRGFRTAGINRISFGVQSFNPEHLARLGRIHSAAEAVSAVELAQRAGLGAVSIDLIFALPQQTLAEWRADLGTALTLGTGHLSVYNLTYEEGTAFHARRARGELSQLPEEIEIAMFQGAQEALSAAGYRQYEISNYARPGAECRHNLNYWRAGDYLGVGAGAHSFSGAPAPGRRWSNEKSPALYIRRVESRRSAEVFTEALAPEQARGEYVFLGLRCADGIDAIAFAERFGIQLQEAFPRTEALQRDGFLVGDGSRLRLSQRGLLVADSIFAAYL